MNADNWLLLTDYSSKYRISVSTLRRRIKSDEIPFKFEAGKYMILDTPPEEPVAANPKTGIANSQTPASSSVPAAYLKEMKESLSRTAAETELGLEARGSKDEPLISTATKLLNELKLAYMNVLHEKEEQIIQLKEEVSDLKTLVRVLEDDNDRMRTAISPQR